MILIEQAMWQRKSSLAVDGKMNISVGCNVVLDEHVGLREALRQGLGPVAGPTREVGASILGQSAAAPYDGGVVRGKTEAQHTRPTGAEVEDAETHSLPDMHGTVTRAKKISI